MESKEAEERRMEPQCKTCRNIFDFPECCTENLSDCFKVVKDCRNYEKLEILAKNY